MGVSAEIEGAQGPSRDGPWPCRCGRAVERSSDAGLAAAEGHGGAAATGGPGGPMSWPGPCANVLRPELSRAAKSRGCPWLPAEDVRSPSRCSSPRLLLLPPRE
eukprot:1718376-Heterocapsa_arctica.AAC.1